MEAVDSMNSAQAEAFSCFKVSLSLACFLYDKNNKRDLERREPSSIKGARMAAEKFRAVTYPASSSAAILDAHATGPTKRSLGSTLSSARIHNSSLMGHIGPQLLRTAVAYSWRCGHGNGGASWDAIPRISHFGNMAKK